VIRVGGQRRIFNSQFCNLQSISNDALFQMLETVKIGGLNENWKLDIENYAARGCV
jgi:hypothetical protein